MQWWKTNEHNILGDRKQNCLTLTNPWTNKIVTNKWIVNKAFEAGFSLVLGFVCQILSTQSKPPATIWNGKLLIVCGSCVFAIEFRFSFFVMYEVASDWRHLYFGSLAFRMSLKREKCFNNEAMYTAFYLLISFLFIFGREWNIFTLIAQTTTYFRFNIHSAISVGIASYVNYKYSTIPES